MLIILYYTILHENLSVFHGIVMEKMGSGTKILNSILNILQDDVRSKFSTELEQFIRTQDLLNVFYCFGLKMVKGGTITCFNFLQPHGQLLLKPNVRYSFTQTLNVGRFKIFKNRIKVIQCNKIYSWFITEYFKESQGIQIKTNLKSDQQKICDLP